MELKHMWKSVWDLARNMKVVWVLYARFYFANNCYFLTLTHITFHIHAKQNRGMHMAF